MICFQIYQAHNYPIPTNKPDEEDKKYFAEQLQSAVTKVPSHDVLLAYLVKGDLNVKIGSDNTAGREDCMIQKHGSEEITENCEF